MYDSLALEIPLHPGAGSPLPVFAVHHRPALPAPAPHDIAKTKSGTIQNIHAKPHIVRFSRYTSDVG